MEIKLDYVNENWDDGVCEKFGTECEPYEFNYSSDVKDSNGAELVDFNVTVCNKCCPSLEKDWKTYLIQ